MAWSGLAPAIASEGPLSLIPMRALLAFPSARGAGPRAGDPPPGRVVKPSRLLWRPVHTRRVGLWSSDPDLWTSASGAVDDTPELEECSKKSRQGPCGTGHSGHRTSPTHFLRGERDRSETKIRTVPRRLAG